MASGALATAVEVTADNKNEYKIRGYTVYNKNTLHFNKKVLPINTEIRTAVGTEQNLLGIHDWLG